MVDESLLFTTFSSFGPLSQTAKIARDPQTGESKGYGFVSYNDFDASDAAIEAMDHQYLMNKPVTVQYAFKKDGKGERHGTAAERLLAAQAKKNSLIPAVGAPPPMHMGGGFNPNMAPVQGFQGGYQGQFAGALAAPQHLPPPGHQYPVPVPQGFPGAVFTPGQALPPPPPPGFPHAMPPGFAPSPAPGPPGVGTPAGFGGQPQVMYGGPGSTIPPPPPGFMTGTNGTPLQ